MEKKFARAISVLFHPLLVPSYFLLILFQLPFYSMPGISLKVKTMSLLFVFVLTFVLPVLATAGMWFLKLIDSFEMPHRNERVLPIIAIAVFFYITFYSLKQLAVFQLMTIFMLGSVVLVLVGLVFNYFYKISQHMMAWGGCTGALMAMGFILHLSLFPWIFGAILISGITGYARLKTESHTPFEVYSGYLLGVLVMSALFLTI